MNTTTLHVGGLHWATSASGIEAVLKRRPGVVDVSANAVAQTATITYDPDGTSPDALAEWVRECGYHCAGRSLPTHVCPPDEIPAQPEGPSARIPHSGHGHHHDHAPSVVSAPHAGGPEAPSAVHGPGSAHSAPVDGVHGPARADRTLPSPHEMMGHGGHAGMSMDAMVADMRNRFLVALLFSIPITLFSPMGREMLGFTVPGPFGLRDDLLALALSLPVIF